MKESWDFLKRNKYVIICVLIVVLLYATGIIHIIWDFVVLVALVILAVYVGKRLQDNDKSFTEIFKFKFNKKDSDGNVYYYQEKKDDSNKDKK